MMDSSSHTLNPLLVKKRVSKKRGSGSTNSKRRFSWCSVLHRHPASNLSLPFREEARDWVCQVNHLATITIGGLPIQIGCANGKFIVMLEQRYGKFIKDSPAGRLLSPRWERE